MPPVLQARRLAIRQYASVPLLPKPAERQLCEIGVAEQKIFASRQPEPLDSFEDIDVPHDLHATLLAAGATDRCGTRRHFDKEFDVQAMHAPSICGACRVSCFSHELHVELVCIILGASPTAPHLDFRFF